MLIGAGSCEKNFEWFDDIGWTEGQVTRFSQWDEKRLMVRAIVPIPEKGKRKAIPPSLLERRGWP